MGSSKDEILNGGTPPTPQSQTPTPLGGTPPIKAGGEYSSPIEAGKQFKPGKYEAMYRALNQEPSAEDYKRAERRGRREKLFASISDGISALSNLFFTSRYAPNIYNGENSLSGKARARYDRMKKDYNDSRIAYYTGLQKAQQADDAAARNDRDFRFKKDRAERADEKDERDFNYRKERDKKADERNDRDFNYRKERDGVKDEQWQKQFDEGKRRHNNNIAARREANAATRTRSARGKQLGFSDGQGNQVAIYENVWKGSMQSIYDTLVDDGVGRMAGYGDDTYKMQMEKKTAREKEDFVKQNWYKSDRARAQMLALSKLDPAAMTSEIEEGLGWGEEDNETDW